MLSCLIVYSVTGLFGYLTFNSRTCISGDVLRNYCPRDIPIIIARVMIVVSMITLYPIVCYIGRWVCCMVHNIRKKSTRGENYVPCKNYFGGANFIFPVVYFIYMSIIVVISWPTPFFRHYIYLHCICNQSFVVLG